MAINDILESANRGAAASRKSLQTTSNNIANANTPGYSRQKTTQVATPPNTIGNNTIGTGVEIAKVTRVHDQFVQNQLVEENQAFGSLRVKAEALQRFESLVSKEGGQVSETMNRFFNDYRELSANTENQALRNVVQSSAQGLANSVRAMSNSLEEGRKELDLRVADVAAAINVTTRQIAGLNEQILIAEKRGGTPNDLYDKRDGLLRDLSQKIDLQVSEDQVGQVTVVGAGAVLVQGSDQHDLTVERTPASGEKPAGSMSVYITTAGKPREITRAVKSGELAGLMEARDKVLNPAITKLDKLAFNVARRINEVHVEGYGADGRHDRKLFNEMPTEAGSAFRFDLAKEVKADASLIATGASASAGDNRIALKVADIQNEKMIPASELGEGVRYTFNESVNDIVAKVGTYTARESQIFDHQKNIVQQLENYRESYSGVSLEEEALDLIKYQTVFNASVKAMKVGDELLQTVLSIKP